MVKTLIFNIFFMASYQKIWERALIPQEEVKYEFSISSRYRNLCFILSAIVGIWLVGIKVYIAGLGIILLSGFYFYFLIPWSNAFAFTNKRVLIHRGWLGSNLISIDYDKITDIVVEENVIDKFITHSGNLIINTAGTGFPETKQGQKISHIASPYEVKKKLDEIRLAR